MRLRIMLAAVCAVAGLAGMATLVVAKKPAPKTIKVVLKNGNGAPVGSASFTALTAKSPVIVRVSVRRQQPGFHGFHIHATGSCVGPAFTSAGGHLKATDQNHGDHIGDMSSLLVKRNGTATLLLTTDRFKLADLRDADGSAVMVHAGPDNYANIPPRYAPAGPDQMTLDTGDSGARVVCGAIAPAAR
ncbi:MAG: superoxide dismutase, Cu-Zn family [Solirubrobacteraceae bacterium]|jgi:Cu-Zn family superoxide dismutase|nr:superoxide dismutase, Cu-Zn family [Solirubrobacteraceae bacterium]